MRRPRNERSEILAATQVYIRIDLFRLTEIGFSATLITSMSPGKGCASQCAACLTQKLIQNSPTAISGVAGRHGFLGEKRSHIRIRHQ